MFTHASLPLDAPSPHTCACVPYALAGLRVELDAASDIVVQCLPSSSDSASRDTGVDASNAIDATLRMALTVTATQVLKVGPTSLAANRVWMCVYGTHSTHIAHRSIVPASRVRRCGMFV